ncbi:MAG: tyrosine-type recombinase/integrase [Chloroflexi bacterium]|nr:tyrosine-type recombinase/integrase [Chloroflexota bacterium]
MLLSKSFEEFAFSKLADSISPETVKIYNHAMGRMIRAFNDPEIKMITPEMLQDHFSKLRKTNLSESPIQIHWRVMRVFFKLASPVLKIERPDMAIAMPRPADAEVKPFSEDEVQRMYAACDFTVDSHTRGRAPFKMKRPTASGDKAILMVLLDTGLRVSELCRLRAGDVQLDTGQVEVKPFRSGLKSKSRLVYLGKTTRKVVWLYLSGRTITPNSHLFETLDKPMNKDSLLKFVARIENHAGVADAHPHRFKHTFAIQYLRNGGDIFTLQMILRHRSLRMVQHYLQLANSDSERSHRKASPVDNWKIIEHYFSVHLFYRFYNAGSRANLGLIFILRVIKVKSCATIFQRLLKLGKR